MFWSAVLDLKTQRPPTRTYGSFGRPTSTSTGFHIPQSIPEHQPVSQFTSPLPDRCRIEEYIERPATALARVRASLQLSEHTQTAVKLLLQGERESHAATASIEPKNAQDLSGTSSTMRGYSELPERTPLLHPLARAHGQEEPALHERNNEHTYWMQELERRRAGLRKSRRRTCTPLTERATTSPLKVGVVMCSVPLVLVLGFMLFVVLSGNEVGPTSDAMDFVNTLLGMDHGDAARSRSARTFARAPTMRYGEEGNVVMALDVSTRLRQARDE